MVVVASDAIHNRPVESSSIVAVSTPLDRGTFTTFGCCAQGSKRLSTTSYCSVANCVFVPSYSSTYARSPSSLMSPCALLLADIFWVCVQVVPSRRNTNVPCLVGITFHH